jgi:hypothetical protein
LWLLLCDSNDQPALWARRGLEQRGLKPFELLTPEMLGPSALWNHRVGNGGASITVGVSATRSVDGESVKGVLNRLRQLPHWRPLQEAAVRDRSYAAHEIAAFFLSWLWALPRPILNLPTPQGLSGQERDRGEWTLLAARSGLATAPYKRSSDDGRPLRRSERWSVSERTRTVIVIDQHVVGTGVPEDVRAACARLAVLSGTRLLGVHLGDDQEGPWAFAGATVQPDLRHGGARVLDALGEALRSQVG